MLFFKGQEIHPGLSWHYSGKDYAANARGAGLIFGQTMKIPYNVQHSKKKEKEVPVKISDNRGNRDSDFCYYKGIDDLPIKYKYALFNILKANLIKIPKIT